MIFLCTQLLRSILARVSSFSVDSALVFVLPPRWLQIAQAFAKSLGLTVPQTLLVSATEVID